MKACERNINQIKFDYEERCIDLNCLYLEKASLLSINQD
jgi:hypothetical protein